MVERMPFEPGAEISTRLGPKLEKPLSFPVTASVKPGNKACCFFCKGRRNSLGVEGASFVARLLHENNTLDTAYCMAARVVALAQRGLNSYDDVGHRYRSHIE